MFFLLLEITAVEVTCYLLPCGDKHGDKNHTMRLAQWVV